MSIQSLHDTHTMYYTRMTNEEEEKNTQTIIYISTHAFIKMFCFTAMLSSIYVFLTDGFSTNN